MFCNECGNKNEIDVKFCSACGKPTGQSNESLNTQVHYAQAKEIILGPIKVNAPDEQNALISIAGKEISVCIVFKAVAVLLSILFFLPLFSVEVRMMGMRIGQSMNGWNAAFGLEGASGTAWALLLLLIPLAILALLQFYVQIGQSVAFVRGKLFLLVAAGYAMGFIVLFITRSSVNNTFQGHTNMAAGFWLTLLFYLIGGSVITLVLLSVKGVNLNIGDKSNLKSAEKIAASTVTTITPPAELPLQAKAIIAGASVLLLISFFLTWVTVDIGNVFGMGIHGLFDNIPNITMSGWNTVSGYAQEGFGGIGFAILFLLIPIAQLALIASEKHIKLGCTKILTASACLSVFGIILLPIFSIRVEDAYYALGSLSFGFYMTAVIYVFMAGVTAFFFVKLK